MYSFSYLEPVCRQGLRKIIGTILHSTKPGTNKGWGTFPPQGLALCVSEISWARILSSLLFTWLDPLVQRSGPPRSFCNKAHLKAANSTFLFQLSFKKFFRAEPNLCISCLLHVSFFPHDKSLPHNFIPYEHIVSTQHTSVEC